MNVLNALTYEVDGRSYRRNAPLEPNRHSNLRGDFDLADAYDIEYDEDVDYEGNIDNVGDEIIDEKPKSSGEAVAEKEHAEAADDHYRIIFDERKRAYMTDIFVPEALLGKLIGTRGSTKRQIEEETNSKINIPNRGEAGPVIIASKEEENAKRCFDRIEMIVLEGRRRLPFTHFIMIPCNTEEMMNKHGEFVEKMLFGDIHQSCKDPSIYVPSSKLHLTVSPLWLFSHRDIEKAAKVLRSSIADFKKNESQNNIKMAIKGLSHMGDEDVDAVKVVYAKVASDTVQKLANHLCNSFVKAGLSEKPRGGAVKLHMTILNTRYLASDRKDKEFIDATTLLKKFGNIDYGTIDVKKIQICTMGETDTTTGGYPVICSENF